MSSWLRSIDRVTSLVRVYLNVSRVDILACDVAPNNGGCRPYNHRLMRHRDYRDGLCRESPRPWTNLRPTCTPGLLDLYGRFWHRSVHARDAQERVNVDVIKLDRAHLYPPTAIKAAARKSFHRCSKWRSRSICPSRSKASRQMKGKTCATMGARYAQGFLYYRPMR